MYHHSWVVEKINNPRGGENNISIDINDIKKYLPYSKGIEQDQDEFEKTIDKSFFNDKNPMHLCNDTPENAFITAMNSLRDLESTKRAFMYMDKHKDVDYDYVIVCRPDVEFLNRFRIHTSKRKMKKGRVVVPYFDANGGVNDRFAIGSYEDIKVYCNRIDEAFDWMIKGSAVSSEAYLKKYLLNKGLKVLKINTYFR